MQLEYRPSYHCQCSFTLASGRAITLKSLSQQMTYAGLLEGTPSQQFNDRLISRLVDEVKQDPWCIGGVDVVQPVRRDYFRKPGDMANVPDLAMKPQWIPAISCVGHFQSFPPARDQSMHASSLSIIWFQPDFAMPIDPTILEAISLIDWTSLAGDFDF